MARAVWKFELAIDDEQEIPMPAGAKVLAVATQYDRPCLWVQVVPKAPAEIRTFYTHGTGHPIRDDADSYVGTYQLAGGSLVFHVFEAEPA